jgi:dihydrofolate synthase/folylpolyglutamate synthase
VAGGEGTAAERNRAVALAAVEEALGRSVDPAPMEGVALPGRLQVRGERPLEVWDGAHNPAGMDRLAAEVGAVVGDRRVVAVFSALADKDVAAMVRTLRGVAEQVIATTSSNSRAMTARDLAELTGGDAVDDPREALAEARRRAGDGGAVLVCGSLYLLHDLHRSLTGC